MAEDMNQLLRRARQNRTPIAPPLADDAESAADAASSLSAGAPSSSPAVQARPQEQTPAEQPPTMSDLIRAAARHTVLNSEASDDQ
jgi:hypothetical protein